MILQLEQAVTAYADKYKPQLPWVTVEKQLYSSLENYHKVKLIMQYLEKETSYTLYVKESLKTNYLYQFLYKYNKLFTGGSGN